MSISDFDREIETLSTWNEMVEWIAVDPTYRTMYLFVTENCLFLHNKRSEDLIPLPESERDKELSFSSVKTVRKTVVDGEMTKYIACEYVHKSNIKSDDPEAYASTVPYEDRYVPATEATVREILRIRLKLYLRLMDERAGEEIKKDQRAMKQMACNFLYAHYINDSEVMKYLLNSESRMQSLMACPGDYKYIVYRDCCVKDFEIAPHIVLHFMETVDIDDFVRPSISRLVATDANLLQECLARDVPNAMKHLSHAIGIGTFVTSMVESDLPVIKREYKRGGADLVARSAHLFRRISQDDPEFVAEMKTILTK